MYSSNLHAPYPAPSPRPSVRSWAAPPRPQQRLSLPDALSALRLLAADQHGYVSTAQALAAGCASGQLRALLAHRFLVRRYHGVYRVVVPGTGPLEGPRGEAAAGLLALGPDAFACLDLAARLHGLQGPPRWTRTSPIHVGVAATGRTRWRRDPRLRVHSWQVQPRDITERWGLRLTTVGRTLRDLACHLERDDFVGVLDSALHLRKISADDVAALRDTNRGRRGARRSRDWWDLADARGRSMSLLETRIRLIAADHGLAPDGLQHRYTHGGEHVATVGLWWQGPPEVAVEADACAAHEPPPGADLAAPHPGTSGTPRAAAPVDADQRRQNRFGLLFPDVRLLRYTWADLRQPQRIADEIRAALAPSRPLR